MNKIDWESFKKESVAYHCDTEHKAIQFMEECTKQNITFNYGVGYSTYEDKTCFIYRNDVQRVDVISIAGVNKLQIRIIKYDNDGVEMFGCKKLQEVLKRRPFFNCLGGIGVDTSNGNSTCMDATGIWFEYCPFCGKKIVSECKDGYWNWYEA